MLKCDRANALHFAPIQGETAKQYLPPSLREQLSTVIYHRPDSSGLASGQRLLRSEAILYALIDTGSTWRWTARIARWLPRRWRDVAYNWVARNRHRFFPQGSCALPSPTEQKKLLP
jgi:predicted DCC family thiol-disulfide oxidoreductase YuxK